MIAKGEIANESSVAENPDIRRAIGLADSCELLSEAFSFPGEDFVKSLVDGSFALDMANCLKDAMRSDCVNETCRVVSETCDSIEVFAGQNESDLLSRLRKGYSILFLAPGGETPVWPYESAFRHAAAGRTDTPILFRSQVTIDVEHHMQEAGVLPKNRLKEPSDSIWNELSLLSYLYGNAAGALFSGQVEDASLWRTRTQEFWKEHGSIWLCSFMSSVKMRAIECSYGAEYVAFANLGTYVLDLLVRDLDD